MMASFKILLILIQLVAVTLSSSVHSFWKHELENMKHFYDKFFHDNFMSEESSKSPKPTWKEETKEFWLNLGKEFVQQQKIRKRNTNTAKNIIVFLGDGMGLTTLVAARNYMGQESTKLAFEEFPYVGLAKTYCLDKIVPDSGAAATACLCGIKANYGTIGVNGAITRNDCEGMKNSSNYVYSVAKWAMDAGKLAGFVTNTRITHATPAAIYAHSANTDWETNKDIENTCGFWHELPDIAEQLIHGNVGSRLSVMMGGGRSAFLDQTFYSQGRRSDGRNLLKEYVNQSPGNVVVQTNEELERLNLYGTQRLLGVFSNDHMDYNCEAAARPTSTQPTLKQMTKKAIEFMQKKEDAGYFLFIESGKIDLAHHENKARLALDEMKEFSAAVELARRMTSESDTLIVVTADHSTSFSVAGYQNRSSSIFSVDGPDDEGIPYEPLSYANGKGYSKHFNVKKTARLNPEKVLRGDINDLFPATVPLASSTHSGEDAPVFASGPWAHLFTGVYEQNALSHILAYAACIGEGLKSCIF